MGKISEGFIHMVADILYKHKVEDSFVCINILTEESKSFKTLRQIEKWKSNSVAKDQAKFWHVITVHNVSSLEEVTNGE